MHSMAITTVLMPDRADSLRRALLALAAAAGLAAAAFVLSSQAAADFLREGPARILGADGDALRILLGGGGATATVIAVAALWHRVTVPRVAVAALTLAGGLFLVHVLLTPATVLVALAVAADRSGRITRQRAAELGPRRYPLLWGAGGVVAVIGLIVTAAVSLYLAEPLFDKGERLGERLDFQVAGLTQPADAAMAGVRDAAGAASPAPDSGGAAADAPEGELISSGELMGVDAFHSGSGRVLLARGPDGNVVLRFQEYEVRNGPGLYIYLTPDADGDVHADGAIELGKIKATRGFVNYDVPGDVDHSSFRAAVIYCKPFSVTFAVATLQAP